MKKKQIKVGQIWRVPRTLEIRTIRLPEPKSLNIEFIDIGGESRIVCPKAFRGWITRTGARVIGHYDFEKNKAVPLK